VEKDNNTLLIISGPVGVGKTTVANELSTLLENADVPHTFLDLDALTYTFPRTQEDPFGNALALRNLAEVWKNARAVGSKNLIIPRVCGSRSYANKLANVVGHENPTVCRLRASNQNLLDRVRAREIGSNLEWHERRSLELSSQMAEYAFEDFIIDTDDLSVTDVASEIFRLVSWNK
jgi:broad-specificity NMP kinase